MPTTRPVEIEPHLLNRRLDAVRDTQQRTKVAFWLMIVLAIGIIVVNFNAYCSWYRAFAMKPKFDKNEVISHMQKALVSEWLTTRSFQVPGVGVKVVVSDACFLAGLTFMVGMTWFFFCQRRENHTIAALLRDTLNASEPVKQTIYHSIIAGMVLAVTTSNDMAVTSLTETIKPRKDNLARFCSKSLVYLPLIAMIVIFLGDVITFFTLPSPFRSKHAIPADVAERGDYLNLVVTSLLTLVFIKAIYVISRGADRFDDASIELLEEYSKK